MTDKPRPLWVQFYRYQIKVGCTPPKYTNMAAINTKLTQSKDDYTATAILQVYFAKEASSDLRYHLTRYLFPQNSDARNASQANEFARVPLSVACFSRQHKTGPHQLNWTTPAKLDHTSQTGPHQPNWTTPAKLDHTSQTGPHQPNSGLPASMKHVRFLFFNASVAADQNTTPVIQVHLAVKRNLLSVIHTRHVAQTG